MVCQWHIQRKKGNLLPKKRLIFSSVGLGAGLALAAAIFVLLYFWSLADMTLEYQGLPFLAGDRRMKSPCMNRRFRGESIFQFFGYPFYPPIKFMGVA
jgi:hypothetical protein